MARRLRIGHQHGWSGTPVIEFGLSQATTLNLATYVYNPQNKTLVYAVANGYSLPSGVSLSGSILSWTGSGSSSTTPVRFTITYNSVTATSPLTATVILNADVTPPSIPTGLTATPFSTSQINLSWNTATDPQVSGATTSGVAGYKIYRDGSLIQPPLVGAITSFSDPGLNPSTQYSYRVSAYDLANNESSQSTPPVTATTLSGGTTDPVAATRLISGGRWEGIVGVSGGIPVYPTQSGATISAFTGSAATINSAISGAANDTYVQLGAGTFNLSSGISIARSRVELRGSVDANGQPTTILNFTGGIEKILIQATGWDLSSAGQFTRINVSSGASRGSTTVTLASTPTTLAVGQIMFISATSGGLGDGFFDLYQTDPYAQIVKVVSKSGNNVTFAPAIDADYLGGTIRVGWRAASASISRSGIRNLSLTRTAGLGGHYVKFQGTDECWMENIKSFDVPSNTYHCMLYGTFRTEIRRCNMARMSNLTNSTYCIFADVSSNALIENNYFHDAPNIMPHVGLHGSAFSYNYVNDLPYSPNGFLSQGVFYHGAHSCYCLFEGNWMANSYNDGPTNGYGNMRNMTYFRNRMRGWDATGPKDANTKCIAIMGGNIGVTMAGNVLGEDGHHTLVNGTFSGTDDSNTNRRIYSIHTAVTDTHKLGNYNTVNDAVPTAEALTASQAFITSYLYSSKPSWFGSLPWPWCDPGNFSQSNGVQNLPAGYRAVNGVDP